MTKLVELALSPRPLILLRKFRAQAINQPQNPHGYAAYQLDQGISATTSADLRKQALSLLQEHSGKLRQAGPAEAIQSVFSGGSL